MIDQFVHLAAQIHSLCEDLPDDGYLLVVGDPPALTEKDAALIRDLMNTADVLWTYARACQVRADLQRLEIQPERSAQRH